MIEEEIVIRVIAQKFFKMLKLEELVNQKKSNGKIMVNLNGIKFG